MATGLVVFMLTTLNTGVSAALPDNATNITVYGLRPHQLGSTLADKDTGDAAGDLFFFLGDRLLIPMACRHDPGWHMCKNQEELDHDSVYTQYTLTVDGSFGGCPSGARECSKYAACNPSDPSGTAPWHCRPKVAYVGKADIKERYPHAHGHKLWDQWKFNASKLLGGNWYSTQSGGNCDDPSATECQWHVAEVLKTVNASCVNENVFKVVETRGSSCFLGCGTDKRNITSDCWTQCFYSTVFDTPMAAADLVGPWEQSFVTDDPTQGGCPALTQ